MAAYSCGERDGGIGHGKRRSRTGLDEAGTLGFESTGAVWQGFSGAIGLRARSNWLPNQRCGRCSVRWRAERGSVRQGENRPEGLGVTT